MPPERTLWPLEDHTRGKHLVLKNYMDAWLPIMRRWNGRVLFIDAFAGPGKYEGGEDGSPVIALRSLINHTGQKRMRGEITYMFIEKDPGRKEHLDDVVKQMKHEIPSNCNILIYNATFDGKLTEVLNKIEEQKRRLAPAFVMIDPFGVSGTPMGVIQRILGQSQALRFTFRSCTMPSIGFRMPTERLETHLGRACSVVQTGGNGLQIPEGIQRKDLLLRFV